jgi:uncharacterized protein (TIGR00304 family)
MEGIEMLSIILIGFMIVLIGFIILIMATFYEMLRRKGFEKPEEKREVEAGGVVIIGPFPIIFGTSQRIARITMILAIIILLLAIILFILSIGAWRWI